MGVSVRVRVRVLVGCLGGGWYMYGVNDRGGGGLPGGIRDREHVGRAGERVRGRGGERVRGYR